jgi:hypothetical protein
MKVIFLIALCATATGCDGQRVNKKKDDLVAEKKNNLASLLSGYWMSDSYLKKLEETKSVFANRNNESDVLGFLLKKENLKSDTACIFAFNSHEGGIEMPIHFDPSTNKFVSDSERNGEPVSFTEAFQLNLLNDKKIELNFLKTKQSRIFRKVPDIQSELRRILFEGVFESIDNKKKFSFTNTGEVTGFGDRRNFEVIYDFGLNIEFDAIALYNGKESGNWSDAEIYKYEINSDTVKLYHVNTNWENMNHKIDDLRYVLKRIKR